MRKCSKNSRRYHRPRRRNGPDVDLYAIKNDSTGKWWDGKKWSWMDDRKRYANKGEAATEARRNGGHLYHVYPVFSRKVSANPARVTIFKRAKKVRGQNKWIVGKYLGSDVIARSKSEIQCKRIGLQSARHCGGHGSRAQATRLASSVAYGRRKEIRFSRMATKHSRSRA